jgi:hypothetical protein
MNDYLTGLLALPLDAVGVSHEPMSLRYGRAFDKRIYVLREAVLLGVREQIIQQTPEIAIFAAHPNSNKAPGYYVCLRLFLDKDHNVLSAVIFCFYDGTEKSPGFKSLETARTYAYGEGFR